MKQVVEVRKIKIGEGKPKICIPLVASEDDLLIEEIKALKGVPFDLVEWRMDYHKDALNQNKMLQTVDKIRNLLGDVPLLATFRTKVEGGEKEISDKEYKELNKCMITSGKIDLIDIEFFRGKEIIKAVVDTAHHYGVKVLMSNHDFKQTPSKEAILERLKQMQEKGADICKIAVMPNSMEDVFTLLRATYEMTEYYATIPVITMSMGKIGLVSRLIGESIGSDLTFGIAHKESAPGQIAASKLERVLDVIHDSMIGENSNH